MTPIRRLLVANRGEIAVRIIRACRALGIESVAIVSEADRTSRPATMADRAVCVGPPPSRDSYLKIDTVVHAALATGCDAVHPGYGFLAEQARFAETCARSGVVFVGPRAETIRLMGDKLQARQFACDCGVPVLPGSSRVDTHEHAAALAETIGYPVLFKAAAGGGGKGMKIAGGGEQLKSAFQTASAEARGAFGDPTLYMERYIANARHVEVQVIGDRLGNVVHLGERDCSVQRRYQKIIEEAPAPSIAPELRNALCETAVLLARSAGYENAGTVEFIVDQDAQTFYFLEMNTRVQVEHPVTEMVTGVDIVCEQIGIAGGRPIGIEQAEVRAVGHAIEARLNAESPDHGFRPSPGRITAWEEPAGDGVRVDTHCYAGYTVPPHYDSLLAKIIVHGADRSEAISRMRRALAETLVDGVDTTLPFLERLLRDAEFSAARINTRWAEALIEAEGPARRAAVAARTG